MDHEDDSQSVSNDRAQENEIVFYPAPGWGPNSWTEQESSLFSDVQ